ncbi:MAG: peptidase M3, partial [Paracoccaceae bacterium]
MTNPLLSDWTTPFDLPPFDRIEDAHFGPAIDTALDEARDAIAGIANQETPPSFANTIEAMEGASDLLGRVLSTFYGVAGADSTEAREELMRDVSP